MSVGPSMSLSVKRPFLYSTSSTSSKRLRKDDKESVEFFGPYLPERQWGTVREDYSADGNCWEHFTHEAAVRRAYRWGEDGLLGLCDRDCLLCCSTALWNGHDPILKERLFGLTNQQGNHGEDVKELYFYLDNTPDHSYMRAMYKYPQAAFPYQQLVESNIQRSVNDPEYELLDTGVFNNNHYWDITLEYAKEDPMSLCCCCTVSNNSESDAEIWLLPQFWFRNTWSWSPQVAHKTSSDKPSLKSTEARQVMAEYRHGKFLIEVYKSKDFVEPTLLFTENETCPVGEETEVHEAQPRAKKYCKDAFHRYIVQGDKSAVNPAECGTKFGALYHLKVKGGKQVQVFWTLRLCILSRMPVSMSTLRIRRIVEEAKIRATLFYNRVIPPGWKLGMQDVARQAIAGLLWSKMYYGLNVARKNSELTKKIKDIPQSRLLESWLHLDNSNIILMPDKWEFPWYAPWDLAFHIYNMARLDIDFAKHQCLLFLSDGYLHPEGKLPSCEFDFDDPNPPLHAWACLRVHYMASHKEDKDFGFLKTCFKKLLGNFSWWMQHTCGPKGCHLYKLGFLGMDNISVLNRSKPLPEGHLLQQADATAWMGYYSLTMLTIALEMAELDKTYFDKALRFLHHFVHVARAISKTVEEGGLWSHKAGLYCDVYVADGTRTAMEVLSWVALCPLLACTTFCVPQDTLATPLFSALDRLANSMPRNFVKIEDRRFLVSLTPINRLGSILQRVFDENQLLSTFGIRSLSKEYEATPYTVTLAGTEYKMHYVPGESDSDMFGGNSNWRGPIWLPMNFLFVESLAVYQLLPPDVRPHLFFPTGSTQKLNLADIAAHLCQRIINFSMTRADTDQCLASQDSLPRSKSGMTSSSSTSISMETQVKAVVPAIRPDGRPWWWSSCTCWKP